MNKQEEIFKLTTKIRELSYRIVPASDGKKMREAIGDLESLISDYVVERDEEKQAVPA